MSSDACAERTSCVRNSRPSSPRGNKWNPDRPGRCAACDANLRPSVVSLDCANAVLAAFGYSLPGGSVAQPATSIAAATTSVASPRTNCPAGTLREPDGPILSGGIDSEREMGMRHWLVATLLAAYAAVAHSAGEDQDIIVKVVRDGSTMQVDSELRVRANAARRMGRAHRLRQHAAIRIDPQGQHDREAIRKPVAGHAARHGAIWPPRLSVHDGTADRPGSLHRNSHVR